MQIVGRARARSGELRHDRVNAARVVADHATDGAMTMRGGIRPESEAMFLRRLPHPIQHNARLHGRQPLRRINRHDLIEVFRQVHHHRNVAALPGQTRSRPRAKEGARHAFRETDGLSDVLDIARNNHANRHLTIVRAIGRIKRPVTVAEADFAPDIFSKFIGQRNFPVTRGPWELLRQIHMASFIPERISHQLTG